MDEETLQTKFEAFTSVFNELLGRFLKANPRYGVHFYRIVHDALYSLKTYIEDPKEKDINWENPYCELQYPVTVTGEALESPPEIAFSFWEKITDTELEDREKTLRRLAEGIYNTKSNTIFSDLTNGVITIKQGGKYALRLPLKQEKKIARLPEKKREKELTRLSAGYTFDSKGDPQVAITDTDTGRERNCKVSVVLQFLPLVIDQDEKKAYFPVLTGLKCSGYPPAKWSRGAQEGFWEQLLQTVKDNAPQEQPWIEGMKPRGWETLFSSPIVKPALRETELIRAGLHAELQKFPTTLPSKQLSIFEKLGWEAKRSVKEQGVEVIGIDLSPAQRQAFNAIQTLLSRTDYKGNLPPKELNGQNGFGFRGPLPTLHFSPSQYLDAYGVKKYRTARGKEEYSGEHRREALQALKDLNIKQHLFVYKRRYWVDAPKGKQVERIDRLETVAPLIKIIQGWEDLTPQEDKQLDRGEATSATDKKLHHITIRPAPIVVDQIDSYFVLKPATYLQEIRFKYPRASKYLLSFVDFLMAQAELRRREARNQKKRPNLTIRRKYRTLARELRMDSWIKTRNWKQIRTRLKRCYEDAKSLGYLLDYKITPGQEEIVDLTLNPDKFEQIKKDESERKRIEAQKDSK